MGWGKREPVTNLVILGDDAEHKKKVGGLLVAINADRMYPDKMNYDLVQKDGEVSTLSGSSSLARQINERDIGKFIKCEFVGWGKSANGRFKMIEVNVWEDEPLPEMKKWPRWAELNAPKQASSNGRSAAADDDFPPEQEDVDDDLPF